jgi:benzodiazapine receptor
MSKTKNKLITSPILLTVSILISNLAGVIGSIGTASSVNTWYVTLTKPSFNPPGWIFGPVWLLLYTLIGISLYLVLLQNKKPTGLFSWFKYKLQRKKRERIQSAIVFFLIHLVVNALWSLVFFGMRDVGSALIVIILLWIMILTLIIEFFKIDKKAGLLLIPYLVWVSFATVLNYSILILN